MKHQIVSRWDSSKVLFECEVSEGIESATRHVLEKAVAARAYLSDAYLSDADLSDAKLSDAKLSGANLIGADLSDANLSGANLIGANLNPIKTDLFDVLLRAKNEVAGLRAALVAGRVDGSTYEGECACLVGTIANVRDVDYQALGNGITPNIDRPIERFFTAIKRGDTPETNSAAKMVVAWIDEFTALVAA